MQLTRTLRSPNTFIALAVLCSGLPAVPSNAQAIRISRLAAASELVEVTTPVLSLPSLTQFTPATPIPSSDAQAVALIADARAALSGSVSVSDVVMNGSATWTSGSTKASGTIQLSAKGTNEALLRITAGSFSRTELRNDLVRPEGQRTLADGSKHKIPLHNCFTSSAWFSPSLIIADLSAQNVTLAYIGPETRDGVSVDHIRASRTVDGQPAKIVLELRLLSTEDLYLDSTTHLPVVLSFNSHPDNDALRDFPIEIHFGEYASVNGVEVPFHIQRMFVGSVQLDVALSSATINAGLTDSTFAIQ